MEFGRECLVFIRGKEKTDEIVYINTIGASVNVRYKNKDLVYSYDTNSATVFYRLQTIDLSGGTVIYENNIPLSDVKEAYQFDGYFSIYFKNGRRTYPQSSIQIAPNGYWNSEHPDTIDYYKEISYKTGNRSYKNLNFVHPESVMYKYLNRQRSAINITDGKPVALPFDYGLCEAEAINNALSNDISIIEGPPGTRKTETIINLILNLAVIRNQTVAVVSGKNAAIENIYNKMEEAGYGFLLAWPGRYELNGADTSGADGLLPEGEVRIEDISPLNEKLKMRLELELKAKKLQEQLCLHQLEQRHFVKSNYNKTPKKFSVFPLIKWDSQKKLQLWADLGLHQSLQKKSSVWTSIRYLFKYCIYDFNQVLSGVDESIYTLQKSYLEEKIRGFEKELKKARSELKARKYQKLHENQKILSNRYIKKLLYDRYHGQSFDFDNENFKEKKNFEEFLKRFPVVLSTSDAFRDSIRENYIFDYLIIDDSSQSDLLTGLQALSCCRKAVIAGDLKQFFQTANIEVFNEVKDPEYRYFGQSLLSSFIDVYEDSIPRTFLYGQYRFQPDVVRFYNEKYYQGKLISYTEARNPDDAYYEWDRDLMKGELLSICAKHGFLDQDENASDVSRYIEYLTLDENGAKGNAIPVLDLLYQDYNAVLMPKEKRALNKLKSENTCYTMLENILKQSKYRHLLFNYNMRLSDILKSDGNYKYENKELIKSSTVGYTIYRRFGKKPELIIEDDESVFYSGNPEQEKQDRRRDALLKKSGTNTLRLKANSGDKEKLIVQSIEKAFF